MATQLAPLPFADDRPFEGAFAVNALRILVEEHDRILEVLDALDAWSAAVGEPDPDERQELARFVRFLADFVDGLHHDKEEGLLFSLMKDHGFRDDQGPLGVMLQEHCLGRALTRKLSELAGRSTPWGTAERRLIHTTAASYTDLLRGHIHKENAVLYPMAAAHLPRPALGELDALFARHATAAEFRARELDALGRDLITRNG